MVCSTQSDQLQGWADLEHITPTEMRKWALIVPMLAFPTTLVINAPFGRFTPSGKSIFVFDGERCGVFLVDKH